jgi:hypothetical protein
MDRRPPRRFRATLRRPTLSLRGRAYTRGVRSGGCRAGAICGFTVGAILTVCALPATAAGDASKAPRAQPQRPKPATVRFATSGDHSEIRERVPIGQRKWEKKRVAMTIGPARLPTLHRGDVLRTTAEVQLTNTCIDFNAARCIGRRYGFSPREDARIVIAKRPGATGGADAKTIAQTDTARCHQQRPNRNHHCVLVFPPSATKIRHPHNLPCRPDSCHLSLAVEADNPHARDGQVVLLGADRPNGTVRQGKGRLNATILRGRVRSKRLRTAKRRSRTVPIAPSGKGGRRVIYSQRVRNLHKGDVLEVEARHLVTISSLPYPVFVGTTVVLTRGRNAVTATGIARGLATTHGVTEQNGFNCTHGRSAYQDPCRTRKAGAVLIRRTVKQVPLYLNVVSAGKAKEATPRAGDRMGVLPRGSLVVRRFRAP